MTTSIEAADDLQGPGRCRRRHHRDLQGRPRDQLADLPRLPGAGPRRALQLRAGRLPAVARRTARPTAAGAVHPAGARPRRLDRSMLSLLAKLPDTCHPMDVVRTAISYLGAEDPEEDDSSEPANYAKSLRMFAVLPTIVAADIRRRRGLDPDRAAQPHELCAELPAHVLRRGPRAGDRRRVRAVHDPLRRAQLQRVHLRRPGGHLHPVRHLQRGHRRASAHSRARCTAAPTKRSCTT